MVLVLVIQVFLQSSVISVRVTTIILFHHKKSKTNDDSDSFSQLSHSIEKHSNSLVAAAKIAAAEQERNCKHQSCVGEISVSIILLRDTKREMTLHMTSLNVINNQFAVDAILHKIQGIEEEIASKVEEHNGLLATPTKSNRSPI